MSIKKGDLVTTAGALKEVVDFLASADGEKLRLLRTFLDGGTPVEDAKLLQTPRQVGKVYTETLEVTITKVYVWEEKKIYWTEVANVPKVKKARRNTTMAKDLPSAQPLPSSDSRPSQFVVEQNS